YLDNALNWLAKMATGDIKGYDVRPAEEAVVTMLSAPGLSEPSLLNAVRILGRLPGGGAQRQLIALLTDTKRSVVVRVTAADEMLRHLQEYGKPGIDTQRDLRDFAEIAVKQPGIDANLRDRLTRLIG